jgi:hypothetical protein
VIEAFASTFASTPTKEVKFLSYSELPESIVPVGSLFEPVIWWDIPSCGQPSIWEHTGVRYIRPSQGCPLEDLQRHHRAYKREVERLARKHGVAIDPQRLGLTVDRLQKLNVRLPEPHTCQTGVLYWGPHHGSQRRTNGAANNRPPWIIKAERKLTKSPCALLLSFLDLVKEPKLGDTLDDCVPPDRVLEWCSRYGLPDAEESHPDERYGCLRLDTFQRETVILYLLFHLWKALIEWHDFEKAPGPSDPEEVERYREAIHRYAVLLLSLRKAPSTSIFNADRILDAYIPREQQLKQQLARGVFVYVDARRKQRFDLKAEYEEAKATVDAVAKAFVDEIVGRQMQLTLIPSFLASRIIVQARSVFDVCYLQLKELMLKPPDVVLRHLKLCEEPCGVVFWARHGHTKRCDKQPRRNVWANKHKARLKTRLDGQN